MDPHTSRERFEELRAQSQRCLTDFLNTEIQLAFTFLDSAASQRDRGRQEYERHSIGEAKKGAATVHHFLDRIVNSQDRTAIADKCAELDRTLSAL